MGNRTVPVNSRPIAIVSIIIKVIENAINIQLINYFENFDIITDRFRSRRFNDGFLSNQIRSNTIETENPEL